jgi:glycosyltransferase involved in cell wall biosynthesis
MSAEKGVATLSEAWGPDGQGLLADVPLRVAGTGPLEQTRWPAGVKTLGQVRREEVLALLQRAVVLIYPSVCFENAPMTILEAFACGTPVIASNLGAMAELVRHGYNGLLFRAGDARDLAAQVRYAFTHPEHMAEMRRNARREYEEKYTPESNYRQLIAIYERAMENARRRRRLVS